MTVTRIIREERVDGHRLGRHIQHDPRSRDYPAARSAAPLRKVLWKRHSKPFDQGNLGSCTGNAVAGAVDTDPLRKTGAKLLHEADAVRIYEAATALDSIPGAYPPVDTGSTGLAAAQAAQQLGLISGYSHAFGIGHALAALQLGPVVTGVDWHEGFDSPDAAGVVKASGQVRGGHEFEVCGYDPATKLVTAWNSWGSSWGKHGMFFFTAATWSRLLAAQGDVTVLVAA